jgi:hypothetical protein
MFRGDAVEIAVIYYLLSVNDDDTTQWSPGSQTMQFEDTKGVIRNRSSWEKQLLHTKLNIEQHELSKIVS